MLSPPEDDIAARRADLNRLSESERRIVSLVAAGRTTDQVGDRLLLSPQTVEWRLAKIYRKLGVRTRTELAAALGAAMQDEPMGSSHPDKEGT